MIESEDGERMMDANGLLRDDDDGVQQQVHRGSGGRMTSGDIHYCWKILQTHHYHGRDDGYVCSTIHDVPPWEYP